VNNRSLKLQSMIKNKYYLQIADFYRKHQRMPSYREIMNLAGFRSKNAVYKLVKKLISLGLIEKDKSGKILPGRLFGQVPLLGTIEAGFPSPAEEELTDTISLESYLVENSQATYILKVTGDSMIEAGIMPGDLVLAQRGCEPKDGDIVIAEVDREWTIKYFQRKQGKAYLAPANKKYQAIVPKEELNITAVVKAVIRKY